LPVLPLLLVVLTLPIAPARGEVAIDGAVDAADLAATASTRLLRFPDLYQEQVVFTYGGDLWLAPAAGGVAHALTTHPGLELFAKFSPDGRWIAFTGQYDGDEQVYIMPAAGGTPRQLTFYPANGPLPPRWGYDNQVYGWTPDGKSVLFRSMRDGWDLGDTRLYTVPVAGGMPVALPMPESGGGSLSADGTRVVYSPVTRDFRHWKRYQGGWAQDLYIFDLESHETQRITKHPRTERDPMWMGEHIYFSSDRDGVLNLYVFDLRTEQIRKLTASDTWDLRWPSLDESSGRIVYELAGALEIYDPATDSVTALSIHVPTDALARRGSRVQAGDLIEDIGLSPKGERALFSARGDIFTAPIEYGRPRNLTRSSGAHDRQAAWSNDGAHIAFVSDADGEEELWMVDPLAAEAPEQLTDGSTGRYYDLQWSPDSSHIAYRNQAAKLFVLDVASRAVVEVADDRAPFGLEYQWSPHGGYLALTLAEDTGNRSIFLWSLAAKTLARVTGPLWNEHSPTWDPAGDYLFYLSEREFRPQLGAFEFNYVVNRATEVYALALRTDVAHPFPPRSDEASLASSGAAHEAASAPGAEKARSKPAKGAKKHRGRARATAHEAADADGAAAQAAIGIDLEGLAGRVAQVPIAADNILGLAAIEGHLLYVQGPASYYGRAGEGAVRVSIFSLEDRETSELVSGVDDLVVSADGSQILAASGGAYRLIPAQPGGGAEAKGVSTAGLAVDRVPEQEWAQIFDEVWRRFRDFFYVPTMHGYDWQAMRQRYRPLLAHVAHRSDLNYLISEMIAELSVGHAYIAGGDYDMPPRPRSALLGARFALDGEAGRYRFREIFTGQNEEANYRSPLTEIGVGVEVGDYLLAINGEPLDAGTNPYSLLRKAGGAPVELLVGKTPDLEAARRVRVAGMGDEDDLLYLRWVLGNRQRVEMASGGRLGYIHLPDMGTAGLREFVKWFYGQVRKQGLVIDVRNNGGGNVSPMIIERLARQVLMVDFERWNDLPDTYPGVAFHGHLVAVIDEDTASDGDQFAYIFRQAGLGPLIGKRTWGGVVGIYGRGPLIDGGSVFVPEAGSADMEGRWVVEGHGVDPDIEVEQDPKAVIDGGDPQLEKAIQVLLEMVNRDPKPLPERRPGPIKTQ